MSDCGLGAADTGSVVVFVSAARLEGLGYVLLFETMQPKPLADNKLSTRMVEEEEKEDAFGNSNHMHKHVH